MASWYDWRDRFYDEECSPSFTCQVCGWNGYASELEGIGEYWSNDPEAPEVMGCPECGSTDLKQDY